MMTGYRVVLAALFLIAAPQRLGAQTPAPEPIPLGDLQITVVAADGKKFRDCTVYVRDKVLSFGESGSPLLAAGVPASPDIQVVVTADARVAQAAGKPSARYVGVVEVAPEAGKTVKVTVSIKRTDDINAYCGSCHPGKGQRGKPGQIRRDVHVSGKPLEGRYREQVRVYNTEIERLIKEGKPHNVPMVLEERVVKEGTKEVKKEFFTCETCHTLHASTPTGKYMRAPYLEKSDLCTGCHF